MGALKKTESTDTVGAVPACPPERVQITDNRVQSTDDRVQRTDDRVQRTDKRVQIKEYK